MMFCVCSPVLCYAFAAVEVLCSPGLTKALNTAVGAPPASNTAAGREKGYTITNPDIFLTRSYALWGAT